jgi:hypothetical protein
MVENIANVKDSEITQIIRELNYKYITTYSKNIETGKLVEKCFETFRSLVNRMKKSQKDIPLKVFA